MRQHFTVQKQMGLLGDQYAGLKRDFCCIVAIWLGRKVVGGFHGMLLLSAKHTILLSDGKTPHERRFGEPSKRPIIPFGSMVVNHPISAKDMSRLHQFGKKVLPGIFLGCLFYAGRMWKGDTPVTDIEELEMLDASEIHARRLNAREVITLKNGENIFPCRRWKKSICLEEIRFEESPP